MIERDGYPAESRAGSTRRSSTSRRRASFYGSLFGWGFEDRMPDDAAGRYLVAKLHGPGRGGGVPAGELAAEPRAACTSLLTAPTTRRRRPPNPVGASSPSPSTCSTPVAWRCFADRENAVFCVWEAGPRGAQAVNEPGIVELLNSTPATWTAPRSSTGRCSAGRRGQSRAAGWSSHVLVPAGVRGVPRVARPRDSPATGGQRSARGVRRLTRWRVTPGDQFPADVPPHWSVTSAVDDADASAAKVTELGGKYWCRCSTPARLGSRR